MELPGKLPNLPIFACPRKFSLPPPTHQDIFIDQYIQV